MRRENAVRLRLYRETLRCLDPGALRAAARGGAGADTATPTTCPNTITSPVNAASGGCSPQTDECETRQGCQG